MKVPLQEIVNALDMQSEECYTYLDRQTGEIESLSGEVLRLVDEGGTAAGLPPWQPDEFEVAQAFFAHPDRFVKLPSEWDIHEWEIMREFAESVAPARLSRDLEDALHGGGAFRHFKDTLRRYRREQDWYDYRAAAFRNIAIEWCEENGIEYTQSSP